MFEIIETILLPKYSRFHVPFFKIIIYCYICNTTYAWFVFLNAFLVKIRFFCDQTQITSLVKMTMFSTIVDPWPVLPWMDVLPWMALPHRKSFITRYTFPSRKKWFDVRCAVKEPSDYVTWNEMKLRLSKGTGLNSKQDQAYVGRERRPPARSWAAFIGWSAEGLLRQLSFITVITAFTCSVTPLARSQLSSEWPRSSHRTSGTSLHGDPPLLSQ